MSYSFGNYANITTNMIYLQENVQLLLATQSVNGIQISGPSGRHITK